MYENSFTSYEAMHADFKNSSMADPITCVNLH